MKLVKKLKSFISSERIAFELRGNKQPYRTLLILFHWFIRCCNKWCDRTSVYIKKRNLQIIVFVNLGGYREDSSSGTKKHKTLLRCPVCVYSTVIRQNFDRHLWTHSKCRPKYTCEICQKSYSREDTLRRHFKEHVKECSWWLNR